MSSPPSSLPLPTLRPVCSLPFSESEAFGKKLLAMDSSETPVEERVFLLEELWGQCESDIYNFAPKHSQILRDVICRSSISVFRAVEDAQDKGIPLNDLMIRVKKVSRELLVVHENMKSQE